MCCAGQCPNCLVNVNGEPTVRACVTPIEPGMQVSHLNAWPSLNRDFLHLVGRLTPSFGMQVGFYYKTFIHPKRAWPLYEKILRSAAGLGKIDPDHRRTDRFEKVHRHVDTLVIGGGRAGLEAAVEAAGAGRETALVDEGLTLGGRLAWSGPGWSRAARQAAGAGAGGGRRADPARLRRRRLRGPAGAGLRRPQHAALPARRGRDRHRLDRTAAGVRQQRPARRHAGRRGAAAGEPVPDRSRRGGRDRHLRRRGHPGGGRPGQRRVCWWSPSPTAAAAIPTPAWSTPRSST